MAADTLGLIAARGRLPLELARAARRKGLRVAAVALEGIADAPLEPEVDTLVWTPLGELQRLIEALQRLGVQRVVLAGKVEKQRLYAADGSLRLDARARALLARLADRQDDTLLRAFVDEVEAAGIRVGAQAELVPELLAEQGVLGRVAPSEAQYADVRLGLAAARGVAGLDIGQTVVVKDGAVMAVEAIEGTDRAIARGCELAGAGAVVVKVAKPAQDPRFDLPAVGAASLAVLARGAAAVLAVEAGRTLVLEREALVEAADAHGIAVVGVAAGTPA